MYINIYTCRRLGVSIRTVDMVRYVCMYVCMYVSGWGRVYFVCGCWLRKIGRKKMIGEVKMVR